VQVIIHNAAYVGTLYYGKAQRIPGKRNPDKKTRWRAVDPAAWIPISVPPILDEATFQAAQALAQRNRIQSKRNRKYDYLFVSGRLRCGQCGNAMAGHPYPNGAARYRCTRRPGLDVIAPHTRRGIVARDIEPVVWEAVERALNNPALITAELERQREGTSARKAALDHERQQYERQLAQCEKDLKRWEAAYLGEAIDLDDFKAKKAEVDARCTSAEHELARLDNQQRLIEQAELETASLREYCERVRQALQHFTLEEKRKALEALNITATWHPEHPLAIQGSIPVAILTKASRCLVSSQGRYPLQRRWPYPCLSRIRE
jgi:hypothetical protein